MSDVAVVFHMSLVMAVFNVGWSPEGQVDVFFVVITFSISSGNLRHAKPLRSNFHVLSGEIELQCFKFGLCFTGHVFACMDAS